LEGESLKSVGLGQPERELEENPARLGKGTSRLWDMILLGRDGMETRQMVLMANHAALDGDSICLWLAQIQVALSQQANAPRQVGDDSSFQFPVQGGRRDKTARSPQSWVPVLANPRAGMQESSVSAPSVVPLGPALDIVLRKSMSLRRTLNPRWLTNRFRL
jgi:hypothetical protein